MHVPGVAVAEVQAGRDVVGHVVEQRGEPPGQLGEGVRLLVDEHGLDGRVPLHGHVAVRDLAQQPVEVGGQGAPVGADEPVAAVRMDQGSDGDRCGVLDLETDPGRHHPLVAQPAEGGVRAGVLRGVTEVGPLDPLGVGAGGQADGGVVVGIVTGPGGDLLQPGRGEEAGNLVADPSRALARLAVGQPAHAARDALGERPQDGLGVGQVDPAVEVDGNGWHRGSPRGR